jgi:hypothetical protein
MQDFEFGVCGSMFVVILVGGGFLFVKSMCRKNQKSPARKGYL